MDAKGYFLEMNFTNQNTLGDKNSYEQQHN